MYQDVQLLIDGQWGPASDGRTIDVRNPATGEVIGTVAHAGRVELEAVVAAAARGFEALRAMSSFERAALLRRAGALCAGRADRIAELITLEQGKPLAEARIEAAQIAEHCNWMAGECERIQGHVIPARFAFVQQKVIRDPVGPVALFTPWNFPTGQLVRKVASAIAAGCAIVAKAPEETPASCAEMVRAFEEAGLPAGALNLVYGAPAEISEFLIAHPVIRKISFTGSTAVGKHLAELAGRHMKRTTMELGGHGPVIVFDDADLDAAIARIAAAKFRNAGQVCTSPTRFSVQASRYEEFVDRFVAAAQAVQVGDGMDAASQMGPLANIRRVQAMEGFVADAVQRGARLCTGGKRIGNRGNFFEPTILTDVPLAARVMNEEPFGPLALVQPFETMDDAVAEANRLDYGLAAYAFTTSSPRATEFTRRVESGMVSINHFGCGLAETPLIGMKDSGYGYESGSEGIEAYLQARFVTVADL
jgi:succinate-semialdehyde dehydrogenase/glutarate-semialdehyde dehydrogenase